MFAFQCHEDAAWCDGAAVGGDGVGLLIKLINLLNSAHIWIFIKKAVIYDGLII